MLRRVNPVMKKNAYDVETIRRGILRRLYRAKTAVIRAIRKRPSEEEQLKRRILRRVKELGRWYEDGNSDLVEFTYHPIPFPGFERVKCHRGEADARLKAILSRLSIRKGDWILDVGANVGFFAFSLERLGAFVEAYETNSASFEIGAALSKLHKTNVLYINKPLGMAAVQYLRPRYKAVLLLSVLHWIVKQEGEEGAVKVLQALTKRTELLFLETPTSVSDGMFQHPLFTSRKSVESFLNEALPGIQISAVAQDAAWGDRFLLCLDCRELKL